MSIVQSLVEAYAIARCRMIFLVMKGQRKSFEWKAARVEFLDCYDDLYVYLAAEVTSLKMGSGTTIAVDDEGLLHFQRPNENRPIRYIAHTRSVDETLVIQTHNGRIIGRG